ncbi:DNA-binding winged helix-turn-helix (wHTH) protein [Mesorhizobium soli]|uniref:helix-turn-helix domain-containing protein n=1 Tax=Pseudaminobacter soli (ex Li et al. 2025) TaxID=1295366 RepID=UPI0024771E3F|nr:helix-turn-helix domain-containing protein [Mesorhizobium soli]MDH6231762.1 DNA-binding winged helix-turn-helix (wHTH) protein [Mesorhizobium soli]
MVGVNYQNLTFAPDYSYAHGDDGKMIKFTRAERLLLADLIAHAGMLRSREQLLDAVSQVGSDSSDRNVDFFINRLRSKIRDSAKNPKFIGTRYGEGYVWVGPHSVQTGPLAESYVVVGPIVTIGQKSADSHDIEFAEAVAQALRKQLPVGRVVSVRPDKTEAGFTFRINLTFIVSGGRRECVSCLQSRENTKVILVRRDSCHDIDVNSLAESHLSALWQFQVDRTGPGASDEAPLAVRLVEAGELFADDSAAGLHSEIAKLKGEAFPSSSIWRKNDVRLRQLIRNGNAPPATRLMLAVNIYTGYIIDGWRFLANEDPRERDQADLEGLILEVLPDLLDDPQNALSAAHVLSFMGPAHQVLALEIAEEAFARSTALADALSILGRLRGFAGDFDGALELLHRARPLCKPGSVFERYITSCICQVLLASGNFEAKDRELESLTKSPISKGPYRLLYANPNETAPSLPVRIHLALSPRKYARAAVLWSYYISARLFRPHEAKENVIVGLARLMRRRFGDEIIPDEVSAAIPATMGDVARPASDKISSYV